MVKLVSAKCPSCGAALKLFEEKERVKCDFCHNIIIVDDAIACYKLKISGNVSVEGITTNSDLIEAANELLDMNEYLKAKRKFLEFSEKCPDNYQGWLGLLICRTRNFTIKDNNIMFENDVNKYYEHFLRVAPDEIKNQYFETIDRYFDPEKYKILEQQEQAEKRRQEIEEKRKTEQMKNNSTNNLLNDVSNKTNDTLLKIGNGIMYFFGGVFVLGGLASEEYLIGEKIIVVLIGLSFFKFIYVFIENKFHIPKKNHLVFRIIIPIILLFILGAIYSDSSNVNDVNEFNEGTATENLNS